MSEHIKERWQLLYYAQVMAMLDHVKSGGKDVCGVSPEDAGRLMDVLLKYAHIDLHDYGDGSGLSTETTVRVNMFAYELKDVNTLWGYMCAGGLSGFTPPFGIDNPYAEGMIKKTQAYIRAQDEKQAACLQAILDYVAECEAVGTKPVKKRVAEKTGYGYDYVRGVWEMFERERRGG